MDKVYDHKRVEEKIYDMWGKSGYFKPEINPKGKSYSIILPPTNANGALHFGHAMYVIEDILIRYHRMKGEAALWLPGTDHAGIETQFVFEKKLREEGKSRLDFKPEELFEMIKNYVNENRGGIEKQLRRLGFSLDWSREKYTLDKDVVEIVYGTFKKLFADGLVYRAKRLVNYCTFDGTSFSDLEVIYEERKNSLYYIKYGPLVLATTRPETKFGDTAVAVNPSDKRYQKYIGKELEIETVLGKAKIKVIGDEMVDPAFGTGVVKITPAHDFDDFEVAKRHNLSMVQVINFDGKMNEKAGKFEGMYVRQARKAVVEEMQNKGLIDHIDGNYVHRIGVCYKCKNSIEPLPLEQWFVKMEPLAENAIEAVKSGEIKIYPKSFEKRYFQFLENIRDWNISRQIVWGIRIPAWFREWEPSNNLPIMGFHERTESQVLSGKTKTYRLRDHGFKTEDKFVLENSQTKKIIGYGTTQSIEKMTVGKIPLDDKAHGTTYKKREELIKAFKFHHPEMNVNGDTKAWVYTYSFGLLKNGKVEEIYIGENKPAGEGWKPDPDTFDTWFSSGQWPYATLKTTNNLKFYPVDVMETGYDILPWWVARMVMLGIYIQKKQGVEKIARQVPFKNIVLHGLVNDPYGKKMSKSKGNVVNPIDLVDRYGADSIRFALVYGTAFGNDQSLSYPKLEAMRKFANKLWNMARFIDMKRTQNSNLKTQISEIEELNRIAKDKNDKEMIEKVGNLATAVTKDINDYNFHFAAEKLYDFTWHTFADKYIEDVKNRIDQVSLTVLSSLFVVLLKLLHPFMPFVTEEIYQKMPGHKESLMIDIWPTTKA